VDRSLTSFVNGRGEIRTSITLDNKGEVHAPVVENKRKSLGMKTVRERNGEIGEAGEGTNKTLKGSQGRTRG